MAIAPSGTFRYRVVVPGTSDRDSWEVQAESLDTRTTNGRPLERLVGLSPLLSISDAGIIDNPGPGRPRVARSRVTLTASAQEGALLPRIAFYVDRTLVRAMRPADVLTMVRTARGGLGLSVVREGDLVAAAGAITAVPLGTHVRARIPHDDINEAKAVFRRRDQEFEFSEFPVEITTGGQVRTIFRGRPRLPPFRAFVVRSARYGIPGTDECVALWQPARCRDVAAIATAQFLDPFGGSDS